jgi:hypothetical protein
VSLFCDEISSGGDDSSAPLPEGPPEEDWPEAAGLPLLLLLLALPGLEDEVEGNNASGGVCAAADTAYSWQYEKICIVTKPNKTNRKAIFNPVITPLMLKKEITRV